MIGPALLFSALCLLPADPLAEGCAALRAGRWPVAITHLEQAAAETTVSSPWARYFLARALLASGDTAAAMRRLEAASGDGGGWLDFETRRLRAELTPDPYAAAGCLLPLAQDADFGPEALYLAGRLLADRADTANALKFWQDLLSLHPRTPRAHQAVLRILDLPGEYFENIIRADNYLALSMARSAVAAEDFSTAEIVLERLARRPIDRRLREEVLLTHADVLFRLSRYGASLKTYQEIQRFDREGTTATAVREGMALCRLHLGDTAGFFTDLKRLPAAARSADFADRLATFAGVSRLRGDVALAQAIRAELGSPVLDDFLAAYDAMTPRESAGERVALELAERMGDRLDRAMARALLAERATRDTEDAWRSLVAETDDDFLLLYARRRLARATADLEKEAAETLAAARNNPRRGGAVPSALRLVAHGYPGTRAGRDAAAELRGRACSELARGEDQTAANIHRRLRAAGADTELAALLENGKTPWEIAEHLRACGRIGRHAPTVRDIDRLRQATLYLDELPQDLQQAAFPLPYRTAFAQTADSWNLEPALLPALLREQSAFDPGFSSGFQFGIASLPVEALDYARQHPAAPQLELQDLFDPARAINLAGWLLHQSRRDLGESRALHLAAAKYVGAAHLPARAASQSDLDWIAHIPFRKARAFLLRFLFAREMYGRQLPAENAKTVAVKEAVTKPPIKIKPPVRRPRR